MQPTRGYTGDVLSQVLIVDRTLGISSISHQDVPYWVDRVMPADTVNSIPVMVGLYHEAVVQSLRGWPADAGEQPAVALTIRSIKLSGSSNDLVVFKRSIQHRGFPVRHP